MTPLVSIVMATRNYARFLPEAVESVRAQTHAHWELVIVDDGSTDPTHEIVRPWLTDRRIRYVRSDRLGQSRAKNLGVALSRGPFVAFLDAVDAWEATKLDKQLTLLVPKPEVGVVFCRRSLMNEQSQPFPRRNTPLPPRGRVLGELFVQNFVCFSSALVRREVLSQVGLFDPQRDLAIDYDLWLRVAKHASFDYVDEELVRYRTGHGNLSQKLCDRVDTALSIMHRASRRLDLSTELPAERIAEAYASTCRTLGYVLRSSEPVAAARWYLRAMRWPSRRGLAIRGLVAAALSWLSGRRVPGSAENASVNR